MVNFLASITSFPFPTNENKNVITNAEPKNYMKCIISLKIKISNGTNSFTNSKY